MPGVAAHHAQEPGRPLIGKPVVAMHPGVLNLGQPRYTPRGCGCCAPRPVVFHAVSRAICAALRRCDFPGCCAPGCLAAVRLGCCVPAGYLTCGCCRLYSWFGLPMESRGEGLPKRETVSLFLFFWGVKRHLGEGGGAQGQLFAQCVHCAPTTIEALREPWAQQRGSRLEYMVFNLASPWPVSDWAAPPAPVAGRALRSSPWS